MLHLNNLKIRTAMNAKIWVFVICVEAITVFPLICAGPLGIHIEISASL